MIVKTRTQAIFELGRLTGNIVASSGSKEIEEGYTSLYEPEGTVTITTCGRDERDEREHHDLKDVAGLQYVMRYGYMIWYKEDV
jgi:hypothetical protein